MARVDLVDMGAQLSASQSCGVEVAGTMECRTAHERAIAPGRDEEVPRAASDNGVRIFRLALDGERAGRGRGAG